MLPALFNVDQARPVPINDAALRGPAKIFLSAYARQAAGTSMDPSAALLREPVPAFMVSFRSPYGGVSCRCKSGRGNRLFARVVIVDVGMG